MLRVMVVAVAVAMHGGLAIAQDEAAPEQEGAAPEQEQAAPRQPDEGLDALFAQGEQPAPAADPAADPAAPPLETIPVEAGEAATDPALELDAMTVTAQKRVQSVVDVPINVTAIGRDDVRNVRIEQVRDLSSYVTN